MELSEVKQYLRLESSYVAEDTELENLISAAEKYIRDVTGKGLTDENKVFDLAVKTLIAHWYENRNAVSDKSAVNLPFTLDCLIKVLALCSDYQ